VKGGACDAMVCGCGDQHAVVTGMTVLSAC
jgi:hypothetical protein